MMALVLIGMGCAENVTSESRNCLSGVIIGNGCTNEGYLIEVRDLKGKEIEVGSVTMGSQTYSKVIMFFPGTDDWLVGDKIYFEISEIPVEKYLICQDFYATAPHYNLITISKNNCL